MIVAGGGDYNIWLDYVTGSGTDLSIKTSAGTTLAFASDWDTNYTQTALPNECIYIGQAGWRKASCDIPITAGAACSTSLRTGESQFVLIASRKHRWAVRVM